MEIKNYVQVFDDIIPLKVLSNLLRFVNTAEFVPATVGQNNEENFNIRKTWTCPLHYSQKSLTYVHWYNYLSSIFWRGTQEYQKRCNIKDLSIVNLQDIALLKYQDKGYYDWHVDHFATFPRTLSCILLLNNDYKGGNLTFRNPDTTGEYEIEVRAGRLIIWPSNFLFPHCVKPLLDDKTRYSVVAWAL